MRIIPITNIVTSIRFSLSLFYAWDLLLTHPLLPFLSTFANHLELSRMVCSGDDDCSSDVSLNSEWESYRLTRRFYHHGHRHITASLHFSVVLLCRSSVCARSFRFPSSVNNISGCPCRKFESCECEYRTPTPSVPFPHSIQAPAVAFHHWSSSSAAAAAAICRCFAALWLFWNESFMRLPLSTQIAWLTFNKFIHSLMLCCDSRECATNNSFR